MEQGRADLTKQGYGLAAISYDSVAILKNFSDRRKISFPLLSDVDSRLIKTLGILNTSAKEGTPFYGIPHPVTFVLDPGGVIREKYFEEDFRERPTLSGILSKQYGVKPRAALRQATAKHVKITTSASSAAVHPGHRILLAVEIEIPKDYHLYAPGVEGYYSVEWKMSDSGAAKPHEVEFPPSRVLYLKAIDEKVPVFEGTIRLQRDVTLAQTKELSALIGAGKELLLEGTLRYQACSDRLCYPPETVPLRWSFELDSLDRERVPPELRRK